VFIFPCVQGREREKKQQKLSKKNLKKEPPPTTARSWGLTNFPNQPTG